MTALRTPSRGFTIQEVLTVLAMGALTLSLAVPGFQHVVADQQRATAFNNLVGTLQVARSTAIMRNSAVTVCPSSSALSCTPTPWDQGWIAFVDPYLAGAPGPDGILMHEGALPAGALVRSAEFAESLTYGPNGQAADASGTAGTGGFWFCEGSQDLATRGLWINASGIPKLVDRQANDPAIACDH